MLDHVTANVGDLEQAKRFYAQALAPLRLGGALVAQAHVFGDRDDPVVELADEDASVLPVRLEEVADKILVDTPDPVEAQVEAPFRELGEEGGEGVRVVARGCPQP